MTHPKDNQGERLERLLQQWGADEAVDRACPPKMPGLDARGASRPFGFRIVLRWAPLAAAAILLIAAVAVVYPPGAAREAPQVADRPGAIPPPAATSQAAPAHGELVASLRKEVQDLRLQLSDAQAQATTMAGLAGEIVALQDRFDKLQRDQAKKVGELEKSLADERKASEAHADALAAAKLRIRELEAAGRVLEASSAQAAQARKQAENLRQRLAAAAEELTRRRKAAETAETDLAEARQQMQQLKVRHREIVDSFRRTYLASLAPGESGIAARKTAARARQMIERLANLSGDARSEKTRQLLARLEAVLTRLELMDANRPGSPVSFQRLVGKGDLGGQIDAVLSAPGESESVRNWLFEAKLILMGTADAG